MTYRDTGLRQRQNLRAECREFLETSGFYVEISDYECIRASPIDHVSKAFPQLRTSIGGEITWNEGNAINRWITKRFIDTQSPPQSCFVAVDRVSKEGLKNAEWVLICDAGA